MGVSFHETTRPARVDTADTQESAANKLSKDDLLRGYKESVERCNKAFAAVTEANMAERSGPTSSRSKLGALIYNTSGYDALQLGFEPKRKNVTKPMAGHFKKLGIGAVGVIRELRLDKAPAEKLGTYTVGQNLAVDIFTPGELVDVVGQEGVELRVRIPHPGGSFERETLIHAGAFANHGGRGGLEPMYRDYL